MYTEKHVLSKIIFPKNCSKVEIIFKIKAMVNTPEMADSVNVLILAGRRETIEDTSEQLRITVTTAHKKSCLMTLLFQTSGIPEFQQNNTRPHTAATGSHQSVK